MAIAKSLPGTPHQVCQFHALRDAGSVVFEQDRGMKTQLKKKLRGPLGCLEQTINRLPESDAYKSVLADYALAIHTTLLQTGVPPFDLAGIQIFDALNGIAASLQRCQKKKSIACWLVC